jgi:hypothetical protein
MKVMPLILTLTVVRCAAPRPPQIQAPECQSLHP